MVPLALTGSLRNRYREHADSSVPLCIIGEYPPSINGNFDHSVEKPNMPKVTNGNNTQHNAIDSPSGIQPDATNP